MRGFIRRQGNPPRHNMKAKPMTVPANARILSAITQPKPAAPAPKPADAKPDWTQLDPDTLSPELRKAYDDYKAANRAAQTARESDPGSPDRPRRGARPPPRPASPAPDPPPSSRLR